MFRRMLRRSARRSVRRGVLGRRRAGRATGLFILFRMLRRLFR